ncbi:hypothetical protein U1Q18_010200 [Sarracenia purpurea var. burkii]
MRFGRRSGLGRLTCPTGKALGISIFLDTKREIGEACYASREVSLLGQMLGAAAMIKGSHSCSLRVAT